MSDGKRIAQELDSNFEIWSDPSLIDEFRQKWDADTENDVIRYQYSLLLSKSSVITDRTESLLHLEYLSRKAPFVRDALYHLALTRYHLGEYDGARLCCEELFRQEPDSFNVQRLHLAIAYKQSQSKREKADMEKNAVGISIGLGVIAAVGVGLAMLLRPRK